MERVRSKIVIAAAALALAGLAQAQTAKPQPLLNPNAASEADLATVPHITPALAKAIVAKRPFANVTDLDALLKEQKLSDAQLTEIHGKLFVPLDLNSATDGEILAIPGIGKRMLHEFKEYRPYKSMDQFRREIGKYIDKDKREAELARLERYVVIK
jgi:DNA uptake protein ComE-like DNA-binding protein